MSDMSNEYNITRQSIPASEQLMNSSSMQSYVESRATAFLEGSDGVEERLGCTDCITRELCASVARPLIERTEDGLIEQSDRPTLQGHGIEVTAGGYSVCPDKLVTTAVRREVSGDFWVAADDPTNSSAPYTRIAEALRLATQSLVEHLDKDIRI